MDTTGTTGTQIQFNKDEILSRRRSDLDRRISFLSAKLIFGV